MEMWKKDWKDTMMILKRKIDKKKLAKRVLYLVFIYIAASWGVNGVVNPVHYIRSSFMQTEKIPLSEREDGYVIQLSSDEGKSPGFLSFRIEAKEYALQLRLCACTENGKIQEVQTPVMKGWNCLDIAKLSGAEKKGRSAADIWEEVVIPKDTIEQFEIVLKEVQLSEYRKADIATMISVFLSFVIMLAFWECVWWVKARYAD